MFVLNDLLNLVIENGASDLHLTVGTPPVIRVDGELIQTDLDVLTPMDTRSLIYNMLTAIIILDLENISYGIDIFEKLEYPPGRMDTIEYMDNKIIIDYAHTPDGIKNIITTVKELGPNNIITIIGCGGNRDSSKRSLMGTISTDLSDYVIFTSDNPRGENELSIIDDIIQNIDKDNYEIITNREKAIIKGIQMLSVNDILLVLGQGHENYQIIGDKKIPFSDKEVVLKNI